MSTEAYEEKKIYDTIKAEGGFYLKLQALRFAGLPDRLVLLKNATIAFIEMKTDKGVLSKKQIHVQNKIRGLGFLCVTCYGYHELKSYVQLLIGKSKDGTAKN